MKFEIKNNIKPSQGDIRDVLKFAWLPTEVEQPYTKKKFIIWLEKYHEQQKFHTGGYDTSYSYAEWVVIKRWIG